MPPATALETARLALRRPCDEDAEFLVELLNQPSFLRYIGDKGVRTAEDARRYLRDGPLASHERHGFGLYLVELKGSEVGTVPDARRFLESRGDLFAFAEPVYLVHATDLPNDPELLKYWPLHNTVLPDMHPRSVRCHAYLHRMPAQQLGQLVER